MTDPQSLLSGAQCYICLGVSIPEALQLALLDAINTGGVAGAKGYRAMLTQTGTNAPTAVVLQNSLGFAVTYSYVSAGNYSTVQSFDSNKTYAIMNPNGCNIGLDGGNISSVRRSTGVTPIFIRTGNLFTQTNVDGQLQNAAIEIIVYP